MKYITFLILAIGLMNCSDDSKDIFPIEELENEMNLNDSINIVSNLFVGNWQWDMSTGGLSNQTLTPSSTGQEKDLIISESQFTFSGTDIVTESFSYTIELDRSIFSIDSIEVIKLPNYGWFSFQLDEFSLILKEEVYDGYTHHYIKK